MSDEKTITKNVAELMVECLEAEGVEFIFGLPGEENADFVVALDRAIKRGSKLRFFLVRHEQGAAFMADVYGRLTGKCAVCFGTLGPGASNLVTGVADANMDRAPMIVITGQADTERLHKESHQNMDVLAMFRPITKWNISIIAPASLNEIVRKAVKIAETEKPGVCHIELPEDVAAMPVDPRASTPLPFTKVRRPVADDKAVLDIWEEITKAKRPIILAGNGSVRTRVSSQLIKFCEATNVPVVSTFMAKGCVPCDADYYAFTVGLAAKDHNVCLLQDADLVISLGFDFVEYHPKNWNPDSSLRIVHLDFLPAEVDRHYIAVAEAVGDLGHVMWRLNELAAARRWKLEPQSEVARVRKVMLADFNFHANDDVVGVIKPQKVLADLRAVLGRNDILLSDVGAHKMWIARYYQCFEPNTCLISNGFCTMGFALPGAIGAKLKFPERKVVAICGDGGFLMNCQEMETATRLKANIVVIVWVDEAYGLIAWKQQTHFGFSTPLEFSNPDLVMLAESFGWTGLLCESSKELKATIEKAVNTDGPVLLAIPIDYKENPLLTQRLGDIIRTL